MGVNRLFRRQLIPFLGLNLTASGTDEDNQVWKSSRPRNGSNKLHEIAAREASPKADDYRSRYPLPPGLLGNLLGCFQYLFSFPLQELIEQSLTLPLHELLEQSFTLLIRQRKPRLACRLFAPRLTARLPI